MPTGSIDSTIRGWANAEDEPILGREGIHTSGILLHEEMSAQSLSAQMSLKNRIGNRLFFEGFRFEINPQQSIEESFHHSLQIESNLMGSDKIFLILKWFASGRSWKRRIIYIKE